MFNDKIIGSDVFLTMPPITQVLYFHLSMRADDDGFVNPFITVRMVGATDADLQTLIEKKFLLKFASGIVVVKHWRINNFIRKDRYTATTYIAEKDQLYVKENMAYTMNKLTGRPIAEVPWKGENGSWSTNGQPKSNLGEDRIGEERVGKVSKKKGVKKVVENALVLPNWLNVKKWTEWVDYRKARRLTTSHITLGRQIQFLAGFQSQHEEIIEQSITQGWQGLFEVKQGGAKKPTNVLKTDNRSKLVQAMKDRAAKNA